MYELSLFTGAGGGILGSRLLGWRTIGYVEWEPYCQQVIAQRIKDGIFDEAPIFTDVREFLQSGAARRYRGLVNIITGGFPCQDISVAGKGKGIDGERSGLWKEFAAIIRTIRPEEVLIENSPMLIGRGLDRILSDLAASGYDAKWAVIPASEVGAPHRRERLWILAYTNSNRLQRLYTIPSQSQSQPRGWTDMKRVVSKVQTGTNDHIPASWILRKNNGLAYRSHRTRAIGNGQCPQSMVAAYLTLAGIR